MADSNLYTGTNREAALILKRQSRFIKAFERSLDNWRSGNRLVLQAPLG